MFVKPQLQKVYPAIGWMFGAIAVLCCTGCPKPSMTYHIEVHPLEDGFRRLVKFEVDSENDPQQAATVFQAELKFFASYGERRVVGDSASFEAELEEVIPADVGGGGVLTRATSELGDVFFYHEQMRGEFPSHQRFAEVHRNLDQSLTWFTDWLRNELDGTEGTDELCAFIDGKLRIDAHDFLLLLDQANRQSLWFEERSDVDAISAIDLLIGRGYFTRGQFARWVLTAPSFDESQFEAIAAQMLASACGLPIDSPAIVFLKDVQAWMPSFEAYLKALPEYAELVAAERAAGNLADVGVGELFKALGERVIEILFANGARLDRVTLILNTGHEPLESNGRWDAEAAVVRWESAMPTRDSEIQTPPLVAVARWCQPDQDRQQRLFGSVSVQGQELVEYVAWQNSLSEAAATAWSELLDQAVDQSPDERRAALDAFRQLWLSEDHKSTPAAYQAVVGRLVGR